MSGNTEIRAVRNLLTGDLREGVGLFLQLNVWLALTAIVMVGATAMTIGTGAIELGVGIYLPSLLVYFIYVRDRRHLPDEDRTNHPYRTRLVEKYQRPLYVTELVALGTYELVLFATLPMWSLEGWGALLFANLPIAILYWYPDLKGNPGLDSLAVAGAWAYLVVFSVVVFSDTTVSQGTAASFLGWLAIVFAGVESRNIGDVDGDEQAGNHTVAVVLGPTATTAVVWGLKLCGVVLFWHFGGWRVAALVVGYLATLRVARALTKADGNRPREEPSPRDASPDT